MKVGIVNYSKDNSMVIIETNRSIGQKLIIYGFSIVTSSRKSTVVSDESEQEQDMQVA
jgi:hypothetical protein